ncbi:G-box-binding factor 3 [Linum grandiflorum]
MGNNEDGKSSSKSEKSSSPPHTAPPEQANIHVYPDWAAMQAYYGPRVALPPYYNSAVASGHPPHPYMWAPPQHMMPHYGAPYAAIYPGGVYAHPAVPMGQHPHGPGVSSAPAVAAPPSAETPTKSSGNTDQSLMKKLKGFDGLAMSIGNGNGTAESGDGGDHRMSHSVDTEGSSDGSDGNTAGGRKRSYEGRPTVGTAHSFLNCQDSMLLYSSLVNVKLNLILTGGDLKTEGHPTDGSNSSDKDGAVTVASSRKSATPLVAMKSSDPRTPSITAAGVPPPCTVVPSETWLQYPAANPNERELKRERRKQSNRESARRSRLRKQAETEELARKVEALNDENMALKSEINQLKEKSDQLRVENATLVEKLKTAELGQTQEIASNNNAADEQMGSADSTENLLSRVNNSSAACVEEEANVEDHLNPKSGAKLRQLLDASPRADPVPAG